LASARLFSIVINDPPILKRGDADSSGTVNITDPSFINNWLFMGGPAPPCMNQADANNDGVVNITDSMYLYNWLFSGGPAPPTPGPYNQSCVEDDAPRPGCLLDPCS
jgi:hypothetical protein